MNNALLGRLPGNKNAWIFGLFWLLTFVLYIPAIKAGWVIDSAGWLYNIRNLSFWKYINNAQSGIPSFYQFTQFTTYIFYKLFNANPYAWHTLMVTMHAVNAFLVFYICRSLFDDSGIRNAQSIAIWGVVLYTVCPHISEIIVWEASYHYLQGFIFILLILRWVQKFQKTQEAKYAWWAGIIYFLSTYSLEIFYLTPWFILALAAYYRLALNYDKAIIKKTFTHFFIPIFILFLLHIVVLLVVYNHFAHIAEKVWQPFTNYACKPARYIYHILFFGRFFTYEARQQVYFILGSHGGLIIFYNILVLVWCAIVAHWQGMGMKGRAGVFLFVCIMISMVVLFPLAFPDMLLMFYDRYTYMLDAFIYMLIALLLSYIPNKYLNLFLLVVFAGVNIWFTTQLNLQWKYSTYIDNRLLHNLPDPGDKTIILLNIPENMNGIGMIGAQGDKEFKKQRELFVDKKIKNTIYDCMSYNMITPQDGAHVNVISDSLVRVTLNQWGTWWWYEGHGGRMYENDDYKIIHIDVGRWYELVLKRPRSNYLLLYQQGDQWKQVDWLKRDDQY